ncbi:MAG: AEC family transporter [Candidatus Magasanikbacteria bacterium]|nr:AEC family transporter [Candidatus Magasanikbacteria bacterium]
MMIIINSILPVFLLIFLGWACTRTGLFSKNQSATLNNYAYYIALPVLIFQSLSKTDLGHLISSKFVLVNIIAVVLVVCLIFGFGSIFKFKKKSLGMLTVACFLGNVAFIGIPFHLLLFGQEGSILSSLSAAVITFLASTLGIYLIEGGKYDLNSLKNKLSFLKQIVLKPIVLAVVISLIFSLFKINLPSPLEKVLEIIAASTAAVSLFAVGIFIYGNSLKEKLGLTLLLSCGSLILMPLIAWIVTLLLPLNKMETAVTILQAGMPLATMNFIFAHQFHIEEKLIANTILLSTVLSAITLPLLVWLLV